MALGEPLNKSRGTTHEACVAHRVGALFTPSLAVGSSETIRDVVCRLPTCVTEALSGTKTEPSCVIQDIPCSLFLALYSPIAAGPAHLGAMNVSQYLGAEARALLTIAVPAQSSRLEEQLRG